MGLCKKDLEQGKQINAKEPSVQLPPAVPMNYYFFTTYA